MFVRLSRLFVRLLSRLGGTSFRTCSRPGGTSMRTRGARSLQQVLQCGRFCARCGSLSSLERLPGYYQDKFDSDPTLDDPNTVCDAALSTLAAVYFDQACLESRPCRERHDVAEFMDALFDSLRPEAIFTTQFSVVANFMILMIGEWRGVRGGSDPGGGEWGGTWEAR